MTIDVGHLDKDIQQINDGILSSKIYPNPNSGSVVYVDLLSFSRDKRVSFEVFNAMGKLIFSEQLESSYSSSIGEVRLNEELSSGIYLVKISQLEKSQYHKMIIRR